MSDQPTSLPETDDAGYRVLARKYRPTNFEDLIGQGPMVKTLSNAFKTGRIAQAYMLTGVRGVGKTTTARILARALNYQTEEGGEPTLDLSTPGIHCPSIMEGNHVDVIEMDAASHTGIGDIREIIASVRYKPVSARYKVYIIDEVHMLSTAAFNGLLKTLEEPPEHVKFIFATTEIRKVPITVLSRCQRFDLRRIDSGEMTDLLKGIAQKEEIQADDEALAMIARAGEGSARDSLSLLDQAIAQAAGSANARIDAEDVRAMLGLADRGRTIDLFEHVMKGDISAALAELKDQYDTGADPAIVLGDVAEFVHFVTRIRYVDTALNDPSLSEEEKTRGNAFASSLSPRILGRAWQMLLKGIAEVQSSANPLAAADMVLVRITHAADLPTPDEAIRTLSGGGSASDKAAATVSGGNAASVTVQMQPPAEQSAPTNARSEGSTTASLRQANGPTLLVDNSQPEAEEQAAVEVAYEVIHTFDDLLNVAEKKRDIRFKLMLRNNVALIAFERGKIELRAVGSAPRDMTTQMIGRLKEWTGETWLISLSEEGGEKTIKEREEETRQALFADAEDDPLVNAVLAAFPKSKIVDVRVKGSAEGLSESDVADAALADPDAEAEQNGFEEPAGNFEHDDPGAGDLDDYFNS